MKISKVLSWLVVISMLLAACGTAKEEGPIYLSSSLISFCQRAAEENPQMTYTPEQYSKMCFYWYGGDQAEEVFLTELEAREGPLVAVSLADIKLISNPPLLFSALTISYGAYSIILMQADTATQLRIPTMDIPSITKVKVAGFPSSATEEVLLPTAQFADSIVISSDFDAESLVASLQPVMPITLPGTEGPIGRKYVTLSGGLIVQYSSGADCVGQVNKVFTFKNPQKGDRWDVQNFTGNFFHPGPCTSEDLVKGVGSILKQIQELLEKLDVSEADFQANWAPKLRYLLEVAEYLMKNVPGG